MIELVRVWKDYVMGENVLHALSDVNLTIKDGEFVAIMGASGSGKSTLMNILGCLDTPTSGDYILDGEYVSDLSQRELASVRSQTIGFVFQNYNLIPRLSAVEQVEIPLIYQGISLGERRELALDALDIVGLSERVKHKPSEMSGGEQQRVAIARAMVTNPSLILADEPTGNLDSRTSIEIMALFQRLNRQLGITIVYVTHEREIGEHAGRIIRMKDGRIISDVANETPRWAPDELGETQEVTPVPQLEAPSIREEVPV